MPDSDRDRNGPPDLDAADLAAVRRAMEGLRDPSAVPAGSSPPSAAVVFAPRFSNLESWVNEFFVLTFGRTGEQTFWCSQWWAHPEAVLRLDALWRTWEAAALDPVHGTAVWIRDYLDPGLRVLLGPDGPFVGCRDDRHVEASVLPVAATPPGWWSAPQHWWEVLGEEDR
jgi:hypothetical protein